MKSIAIFSTKGGVGKSTISCGLATALKAKGYRIGLLDMDFAAPDVDVILNLKGKRPEVGKDRVIKPVDSDGLKVFGWGMVWPTMSAVEIEGQEIDGDDLIQAVNLIKAGKTEAAVKHLEWLAANPGGASYYMKLLLTDGNIDWGSLDFMVLDTPPESSGVVKVLIEHGLHGGIIVTHPSSVSLADVTRTVDLMTKHAVPIYGVVSNQGRNERQTDSRYDRTDKDVQDFAEAHKLPFIGAIPHTSPVVFQNYMGYLADFVLNNEPTILKRELKPSMKGDLVKFARLLEALKK